MLKPMLALLALCTVTSAFAMSDAELSAALRKDLQKYVVTVNAPKLLFHWADASDITPQGQFNTSFPAASPQFKEYVDRQGKKIFNPRSPKDRDIAGPGLYMAAEPMLSRSYGGKSNFGLIVGVIRPGARILKITDQYKYVKVPTELLGELEARNCHSDSYADILFTSDTCTKAKQILVGKDISFADGMIYDWRRYQASGCSFINVARDILPKQDALYEQTFVAYNSNMFSAIYGYTPKSKMSGDKFADSILSYLKGYNSYIKTYFPNLDLISKAQLADPSIPAMSPEEIATFGQKNILGCMK